MTLSQILCRSCLVGSFVLLLSLPTLACGSHGSVAGRGIQSWINSQWKDSGFEGSTPSAVGSQRGSHADYYAKITWGYWEEYYVTVNLPTGNSITIGVSPKQFSGPGALEHYLEDQGKQAMRDWFQEYRPPANSEDRTG